MSEINIKGIDKAELLAALYNNSRPLGMGHIHYDPADMTKEEAQSILGCGQSAFDYLKGRVMKVDLSGDTMRCDLHDPNDGVPLEHVCSCERVYIQDRKGNVRQKGTAPNPVAAHDRTSFKPCDSIEDIMNVASSGTVAGMIARRGIIETLTDTQKRYIVEKFNQHMEERERFDNRETS